MAEAEQVKEALAAWRDLPWPDWIPLGLRRQIEGFWSPKWGRSPEGWVASAIKRGHRFGITVAITDDLAAGGANVSMVGRWVYAWGGKGWVVLSNGRYLAVEAWQCAPVGSGKKGGGGRG